MSETPSTPASPPDPKTEPVYTPPQQRAYVEAPKERRRSSVTTVAAWVGIVAGVVFIVAVVFFSGFVLGKNSAGGSGHHRDGGPGPGMLFHRDGPQSPMFPMGPRGQFERPGMPGMQPGMPGPGQTQPGSPTTPPARP